VYLDVLAIARPRRPPSPAVAHRGKMFGQICPDWVIDQGRMVTRSMMVTTMDVGHDLNRIDVLAIEHLRRTRTSTQLIIDIQGRHHQSLSTFILHLSPAVTRA
jgi:hypothetical protein